MRVAILSRNKNLHSIRRLLQESRGLDIDCTIINPLECQLVIDGKQSSIQVGSQNLPEYDAVVPRIGASITDYGLAVVRQFETLGTFVVNGSQAIAESRDKLRSLQILTGHGLQVPASVLTRSQRSLRSATKAVKGLPVVLKILQGTQGVGVMLVNTQITLGSVMDTLRGLDQDVIIQQFIAEGAGKDYRAFVIGDRVVAAMMRTAPEGEFRSNIHRGGEGTLVKLPRSYANAAVKAAKVLGLRVAGVDLMSGKSGPLIIEVNSSPGFEGIEKATGLNIAREIMLNVQQEALKSQQSKSRAKARRR